MRTETKLRTDPPINARDFGVPAEFAERAESYARWAVAQEREACARICDEHADDPVYCGSAIRARQ